MENILAANQAHNGRTVVVERKEERIGFRNGSHAVQPEEEFKFGAVRAAVWNNLRQTQDGKTFSSPKAVLERIYKDGSGQFRTTNSLDLNDIPKAILVLQKSYEFIMSLHAKNNQTGVIPTHGERSSRRYQDHDFPNSPY